MKKHLTTTCLFVVTIVATVSFITPAVFGQEKKAATANPSPDEALAARVDKLFEQWDKPDSPGCALTSFTFSDREDAGDCYLLRYRIGLGGNPYWISVKVMKDGKIAQIYNS